jgi:hypothetical protein
MEERYIDKFRVPYDGEKNETARQNTGCVDKTVKVSDACSKYCHTGHFGNPAFPSYKITDPYPGERAQR